MYLNGVTRDYPWTRWDGPDVLFGGGAEVSLCLLLPLTLYQKTDGSIRQDYLPSNANRNVSQFDRWAARGYSVVHDNTTLAQIPLNQRALGIFNTGSLRLFFDLILFSFFSTLQETCLLGSIETSTRTRSTTPSPGTELEELSTFPDSRK